MVKNRALRERILGGLFFLVIGALAVVAQANAKAEASAGPGPHEVVEHVTTELMTIVVGNEAALKEDSDQIFQDVRKVMEKAVDFRFIASAVMGPTHWKAATPEQRENFVEVFTQGMVETYVKGMAGFAGLEMTVQKPDNDLGDKRRVEVIQRVSGPDGVSRVSYTMGKHRSGDWRLINVVLNGVNLGQTLRTQFAQSVVDNKGDINLAIAGWKTQP